MSNTTNNFNSNNVKTDEVYDRFDRTNGNENGKSSHEER